MKLSFRDALTGLANRFLLDEIKSDFIRREAAETWICIMIDVDHFKLINDLYGHLKGDRVLVEIAGALQKNFKNKGVLLRFGGDEFLVVLKNESVQEILKILECVMADVRKLDLFANLSLSLSVGIAESQFTDNDILAVIDRADKALYDAKAMGRGRTILYSEKQDIVKTEAIRLGHFVGRRAELHMLHQLLEETVSSGPRLALIEGDPGIGKSRLAAEVIQYAHFRNCGIMHSGCFQFGDIEPYTFFLKPIRKFLKSLAPGDIQKIKNSVGIVHPATAELFSELKLKVTSDLQYFREDRLKFIMFEDFAKIFSAISKWNPVLFIVDDIHWMTAPDMELFKFLVRSSGKNHIMFIVTMRDMEESSGEIRNHLQSLNRAIPLLNLKLSNLEQQETYNLIMFALKDPNVPQKVLETLYRQSGGNPFFLEELINSMIQTGAISKNSSGDWTYYLSRNINLPESLAQLMAARLYPLTSKSRNYLRIAALSTGSFSVDMIATVTGDSFVEVMEGLEEPVRLNLVQCIVGKNRTVYRFVHDTICSFLHRELSDAMKKIYHKRIAEYLETRYHSEPTEELVIDMAYHYQSGDGKGKTAWSALLASQVFEKRQAYRETARFLEIYCQNCEISEQNRDERFKASLTLGVLYTMFGDFEKAMHNLDIAQELAIKKDDISTVKWRRGQLYQTMCMYNESRKCYDQAFASAVSGLKKIDALNSLAFLNYVLGSLKNAQALIRQAENLLTQIDTDYGTREYYMATLAMSRGIVAAAIMPGSEAVAEYEKALNVYIKYEDFLKQAVIYNNLSDVFISLGQYEKALESIKKALKINNRLGDVVNEAIALHNTAVLYVEINQLALAREYFLRYNDIDLDINDEIGQAFNYQGSGMLYEEEGDFERAEMSFRKAIDVFEKLGIIKEALSCRIELAHLLVINNKIDEAEKIFLAGLKKTEEILEKDIENQIFFIKGLLKYKKSVAGDVDALNEAEELIERSLEGRYVYTSLIMRSYYYLIELKRFKKEYDQADQLLQKARNELEKSLNQIEKVHFRESFRNKGYIKKILEGV